MATQDQLKVMATAADTAGAAGLSRMLSGPDPSIAISAIGQQLLGDMQASDDDVVTAIQTPVADLNIKLKDAEQQCLSRLTQAASSSDLPDAFPSYDMTQTDLDNTKDARERQITLHDNTNKWLAYGISVGFFVLIFVLLLTHISNNIDEGVRNLLFTLLGVVATGWATIIGYYFGSSAGSKQKSQTLTSALNQALKK
jgi:hypothetical protein